MRFEQASSEIDFIESPGDEEDIEKLQGFILHLVPNNN